MPKFSPALRDAYARLFDTCQIRPERADAVARLAGRIVKNRDRYAPIEADLGVPWYAVGLVHAMETVPPLSFSGHLHNGDPLSARTIRVPAGRPPTGAPPFTWEESARDALTLGGFAGWSDWRVPGLLFALERYNGWGYQKHHPTVLTPYLWSFTNHYERGKYVADGRFSATARSAQCGAAALLRSLVDSGVVAADPEPAPLIGFKKGAAPHVEALQNFLNGLPLPPVAVDGLPGPQTSAALKRALGHYLAGDPRTT